MRLRPLLFSKFAKITGCIMRETDSSMLGLWVYPYTVSLLVSQNHLKGEDQDEQLARTFKTILQT